MTVALAGISLAARAQAPGVITEDPRPCCDDTAPAGEVSFTLNVNVDLVELQVLATDAEGRHVTTLAAGDFTVTEDSVGQNITLFRQNDLPVSLGLVIDNSRSMERKKDRVDAAALSFVGHNNPDDEAFLIHFDDTARLAQGFTRDTRPIRETLVTMRPYGQTALFDAVSLALETMALGAHKQRAILVISDGADNASTQDFESVLEQVRQSGAGLETRSVLERLAEVGGGRAFFPADASEVPALTLQIAQEIRDQYTLGYIPTNFRRDGTWRSVRIGIRQGAYDGQVRLTYRHGYYAPGN
jgi:Ca-activated chloride channel family protein